MDVDNGDTSLHPPKVSMTIIQEEKNKRKLIPHTQIGSTHQQTTIHNSTVNSIYDKIPADLLKNIHNIDGSKDTNNLHIANISMTNSDENKKPASIITPSQFYRLQE